MAKTQRQVQSEYRERKREMDNHRLKMAALSINIPKTIRHAADCGVPLAVAVMAPTDEQILKNLEVYFYEMAREREPHRVMKKIK
jgi:hypothetical protein